MHATGRELLAHNTADKRPSLSHCLPYMFPDWITICRIELGIVAVSICSMQCTLIMHHLLSRTEPCLLQQQDFKYDNFQLENDVAWLIALDMPWPTRLT